MSNGLFSVDGIDVAGLVARHVGPRLLPCVLYKGGGPGTRSEDNPTEVSEPGEPVPHRCRGFIADFAVREVDGSRIKADDRKVSVLGESIEGGAVPASGDVDMVEVEGTRYLIHRVLSRDAAGANYVLQVRDM